ncbi:HNH endonuclease [Amycolatopsis sp. H20-H5]|uniref:HNH endonuclease n=1 Tax=Amycolatopsis sp. H20-H5 TaxID=3046309 RepID=UPI002DB5E897|nr:HNH endonuclease [Amycolatopsis sp. H20-H5]MEC3974798.1 HNH endonuclease [Amycolatopsis sp. H20-H5]
MAHHLAHWSDPGGAGGRTDIINLSLVCEGCHRLIHHGEWDMRLRHGIIEWLPPKWLDPERRPIRNTAHDPPRQCNRRQKLTNPCAATV